MTNSNLKFEKAKTEYVFLFVCRMGEATKRDYGQITDEQAQKIVRWAWEDMLVTDEQTMYDFIESRGYYWNGTDWVNSNNQFIVDALVAIAEEVIAKGKV